MTKKYGILSVTLFVTTFLLVSCAQVHYKMLIVPDYAHTEKLLSYIALPCDKAQEKAAKILNKDSIFLSVNEPHKIVSSLEHYTGETKGFLFKTTYEEELAYIMEFNSKEEAPQSCTVALYGAVCERPGDRSWECKPPSDTSRAEKKIKFLKQKLDSGFTA